MMFYKLILWRVVCVVSFHTTTCNALGKYIGCVVVFVYRLVICSGSLQSLLCNIGIGIVFYIRAS